MSSCVVSVFIDVALTGSKEERKVQFAARFERLKQNFTHVEFRSHENMFCVIAGPIPSEIAKEIEDFVERQHIGNVVIEGGGSPPLFRSAAS